MEDKIDEAIKFITLHADDIQKAAIPTVDHYFSRDETGRYEKHGNAGIALITVSGDVFHVDRWTAAELLKRGLIQSLRVPIVLTPDVSEIGRLEEGHSH